MLDCWYVLLIADDDDVKDPDIIESNFCSQSPVNHAKI